MQLVFEVRSPKYHFDKSSLRSRLQLGHTLIDGNCILIELPCAYLKAPYFIKASLISPLSYFLSLVELSHEKYIISVIREGLDGGSAFIIH